MGRSRTGRPRALARRIPAAAVLAVLLTLAAAPAVAQPRAQADPQPGATRFGSVILVLVKSWSWEQARAVADVTRFDGPSRIPAAAGLVSTLPPDASLESRLLSLATGTRVDARALRGGATPAAIERLKADNKGASFGGLPPVRVLADPGLEQAGLFGLGDEGPVDVTVLDPSRPLVSAVPAAAQAPAQSGVEDSLVVVALPDVNRLVAVLRPLVRVGRVLVVGLEPEPGHARTAPFLELGGETGVVTSDGTRRRGLVALEDVRATVLVANGADPAGGTPVRVLGDPDPLGDVTVLDRQVAALVAARTVAIPVAAGIGALALLLAVAARSRTALRMPVRWLLLGTLAVPSGYLVASRAAPPSGVAWLGLGLGVAAAVTVAAWLAGRAAPAALGGLLLALVTLDLVTGGEGLARPLLGGSAYDGERFYGLGNGYFAYALAAAVLVVAFLPLTRLAAVALLAGLALVDGLPALGADVGGALAAMLAAAAAWVLLGSARPQPLRVALIAIAALAAGLGIALGVGLVTGDATHASRFVGEVGAGGPTAAVRVFAHKLEVNAALLATNPFAWVGPLVVALAALLAARPPRSATVAAEPVESGSTAAGAEDEGPPEFEPEWLVRPAPGAGNPAAEPVGPAERAPGGAPAAEPVSSAEASGPSADELAATDRLETAGEGPLAEAAGSGGAGEVPAAGARPAGTGGWLARALPAGAEGGGQAEAPRSGWRVRRAVLVGVAGAVGLILLNDTGVTAAAGCGLFLLVALAWAASGWAEEPVAAT